MKLHPNLMAIGLCWGAATALAAEPWERAIQPAAERSDCPKPSAREPARQDGHISWPQRRAGDLPKVTLAPPPEDFQVQCACIALRGMA
jgi:hypothetical protein